MVMEIPFLESHKRYRRAGDMDPAIKISHYRNPSFDLMPNLAPVKFMPGDHYGKSENYYDPKSTGSNKCCICESPIKGATKKNDGKCPNPDCSRDSFFKETHRMLEEGRWDKFVRSTS